MQMNDTPDQPVTAATVLVSAFQMNMAFFRVERFVNWATALTGSVSPWRRKMRPDFLAAQVVQAIRKVADPLAARVRTLKLELKALKGDRVVALEAEIAILKAKLEQLTYTGRSE